MPELKPYHHTDLRKTLLQAAVAAAQAIGPERVSLREVARQAGVSPTAAYRHFANHQALLEEVKHYALELLADRVADALEASTARGSALQIATTKLHIIWDEYIRFALEEPGLFRAALNNRVTPQVMPEVVNDRAYALLGDVMDAFIAAGGMPRVHKQQAQLYMWAAMHGLAELCIHGPLANLSRSEQRQLSEFAFEAMQKGITAPS